ncbi:uncharacterized protein LOC127702411 [Mytilus californianus]|uniref:uncharacterized protein LOC127702411 n=1 Tax=Mytilus californianus TaxID=6549 RepID=UPI002247B70D|nr:uncharacterized protein LOC127702411 [Mytilus californianus]
MITDVRTGPNQTHQVQPDVRASRVKALRILGGLQIGLGLVYGILCIVGAILCRTDLDSGCKYYNYYSRYGGHLSGSTYYRCGHSNTILIMNLIGMALSGWFILTGCVPLCMTDQRQSSWRCLTIAFLVCNIISTVVFSSTVFSLAVIGALIVAFSTNTGSVITVSVFLAVFSFIEFIISIVAASHCCCCSQLNTGNQQEVIFMNIAQSGMSYNMPNTPIPTGNQQGYHQMWMPQMQGFYGQRPANMPNYQQQAGHSHGNQMPVQGYYGQ